MNNLGKVTVYNAQQCLKDFDENWKTITAENTRTACTSFFTVQMKNLLFRQNSFTFEQIFDLISVLLKNNEPPRRTVRLHTWGAFLIL